MKGHKFIEKAIKKPKIPKLSEHQIHCVIGDYLNTVIKKPSRWMTIEVSNQANGKAAMFRQIALKRKGVVTGTPDIFIFWSQEVLIGDSSLYNKGSFRMIFLEVKVPGGKLTDKQEALHKELRDEGHSVFVVYSVDDVKRYLKELGVI